jgi:hypothetical protein
MTKPKPCRYERSLGYRAVKGEHDDGCTDPTGHRGCVQCTLGHCGVCGRKHLEDQHPATCPDCVGSVREDLTEIAELCRGLRRQAVDAEGLSWASARIPGATAMVAMAPTVQVDQVRVTRTYAKDHRPSDMVPPLAVLARWQDLWAGWLGVTPTTVAVREQQARADWLGVEAGDRASITRTIGFLDRNLTLIAQTTTSWVDGVLVSPPEFTEFARDIGKLRAQLERRAARRVRRRGGDLVLRVRPPAGASDPGPEAVPAQDAGADGARSAVARSAGPAAWLQVLRSYGLPAWPDELEAARLPSPVEVAAARLPCDRCDQGGLADPTPGISWECPSCRMRYTPGEYANAVRRDLADRKLIAGDLVEVSSLQSYGWTDITLAADAASTLVGHPVFATTVRKWAQREKVAWCCAWSYEKLPDGELVSLPTGQRLVFWPDVADEANKAVARAVAAAAARARKAVRDAAKAVLAELDQAGVVVPEPVEKALLGQLPVTEAGDLDDVVFRLMVFRAIAEDLDEAEVSATSGKMSA